MKRYIIMLLSLLAVTTGALAQSEMEITGKVTDPTGEELIGVSVVVKDVKGLGSSSPTSATSRRKCL